MNIKILPMYSYKKNISSQIDFEMFPYMETVSKPYHNKVSDLFV